MAKGCRIIFFWGGEGSALKLIVMMHAQLYEYTKSP